MGLLKKIVTEETNKYLFENLASEMQAFHGSAAEFSNFDTSFMGTGEGAQAFGWGIYVTADKGTGEHYAVVASRNKHNISSYNQFQLMNNYMREMGYDKKTVSDALQVIWAYGSLQKAKEAARDYFFKQKEISYDNNYQAYVKNRLDLHDEMSDKKMEFILHCQEKDIQDLMQNTRNLYTVDIPDDDGRIYLSWGEAVRAQEIDRIFQQKGLGEARQGWKGSDIYRTLIQTKGSPKNASKYLESLGYVGIKVPCGFLTFSRGNGKGFNYVIFNEKDIKIINHTKY